MCVCRGGSPLCDAIVCVRTSYEIYGTKISTDIFTVFKAIVTGFDCFSYNEFAIMAMS